MDVVTEIVAVDTKEGFGVIDVTDRVDKLVVASRVEVAPSFCSRWAPPWG